MSGSSREDPLLEMSIFDFIQAVGLQRKWPDERCQSIVAKLFDAVRSYKPIG